ncbi:MAG: PAS domain-containing protein [Candidatus Paceibacterota bacterium]|jgi:PAS domain S-box-containing protein
MEEINSNNLKQIELGSDVYRAIIDALSENAIFSVTDEKGDIVYANQKFVEISKYPLEELLGQNHRILKSGHQPQEIFVELWKTISSGKIWHGEVKNRAKDGTYYWVEATIVPIFGSDGSIKNYAALRTPIDDRKGIEEKEKSHLDELERMNKFVVDRELKMVALKDEIKNLEEELIKCRNNNHIG